MYKFIIHKFTTKYFFHNKSIYFFIWIFTKCSST